MKYGFIGCGNMGGAIATALAKSNVDIMVSDRSGKAKELAKKIGCVYADAETVAKECDRIFLAVKPQMMTSVLEPLQKHFADRRPLLITMAAGLSMNRIEAMAGTSLPIIRIMPNTPVAVGCGMTQYCYNELVDQALIDDFVNDMRYCGTLDMLSEELINAASALSGSGPAYMYLFIQALADGAAACGVPADKAVAYATATMAGAAEMVLKSGQSPEALKNAVCSPGGSTLEGLKVLEEQGFRDTVADCIRAAYKRNLELGK